MGVDYTKFSGSLPYASELYGIYQPLLGWKSKQVQKRVSSGLEQVRNRFLVDLSHRFEPVYELHSPTGDPREAEFKVSPATPSATGRPVLLPALNGIVVQRVDEHIREGGLTDPRVWKKFTSHDALVSDLAESTDAIREEAMSSATNPVLGSSDGQRDLGLQRILERESVAAGVLEYLNQRVTQSLGGFLGSFREPPTPAGLEWLIDLLGTQSEISRAVISPIGMVHLFRQYFFEFDSFLGPSVQHVWLSPGGTVEMVEVSTRKTTVERTTEQAFETTQKSEKSLTEQDELSEAVRSENTSDSKLGVSSTVSLGYNAAFVSGSGSVSGSFSAEHNEKRAREETHKNLRQQTTKLATEIRQNYKSTFRIVTETTDVNSRRYVLANNTPELMNYELRRKMRQVGVQVQDYGTQLCWQAFVDDPGRELGIADLVHIASPPDLQDLKEPEKPPQPEPLLTTEVTVSNKWGPDDDRAHHGFVPFVARLNVVPPKPGYIYTGSQVEHVNGPNWWYRARPETANDTTIDFEQLITISSSPIPITVFVAQPTPLKSPDIEMIDAGDGTQETSVKTIWVGAQADPTSSLRDDNDYDVTLKVTLSFRPSKKLLSDVEQAYNTNMTKYADEKSRRFQEALFKEARDRVKVASNIQPRGFDDLREEERTVVYRSLTRQLLAAAGITYEDNRVGHVFAELVESLFDVDRMLYFVSPEWWKPRFQPLQLAQRNPQDVGLSSAEAETFQKQDVVSWGGAKEALHPDNYYITEDSTPAKLGSSLGWLLQLDGDNLRNAFLNAPWVKAVVPIRVEREWDALAWLSNDQVEGSDGLDDLYEARHDDERSTIMGVLRGHQWDDPALAARYSTIGPADLTVLDAIRYLIVRIQEKQQVAATSDAALGCLPTDKVFEHGFDPLQGGFQADPHDSVGHAFEIFDQWIEILPTDQIVPVEVTYDPKTGMQV